MAEIIVNFSYTILPLYGPPAAVSDTDPRLSCRGVLTDVMVCRTLLAQGSSITTLLETARFSLDQLAIRLPSPAPPGTRLCPNTTNDAVASMAGGSTTGPTFHQHFIIMYLLFTFGSINTSPTIKRNLQLSLISTLPYLNYTSSNTNKLEPRERSLTSTSVPNSIAIGWTV